MIVTVVVGILATIAATPVTRARERARVAAVRHELSTTVRALVMYEIEHGRLPAVLGDLTTFQPGRDVKVCRYEINGDSALIQYQHRGSKTRVDGHYGDGAASIVEQPNAPCGGGAEAGEAEAGGAEAGGAEEGATPAGGGEGGPGRGNGQGNGRNNGRGGNGNRGNGANNR